LKDDGKFGDGAWGGNKVRKLEWLLPDARRRQRRTILTFGGLGTNWGLATALYGREYGLTNRWMTTSAPSRPGCGRLAQPFISRAPRRERL
jgi:D-cysteine desulfhydrase